MMDLIGYIVLYLFIGLVVSLAGHGHIEHTSVQFVGPVTWRTVPFTLLWPLLLVKLLLILGRYTIKNFRMPKPNSNLSDGFFYLFRWR